MDLLRKPIAKLLAVVLTAGVIIAGPVTAAHADDAGNNCNNDGVFTIWVRGSGVKVPKSRTPCLTLLIQYLA
jgi:hypothetical protein